MGEAAEKLKAVILDNAEDIECPGAYGLKQLPDCIVFVKDERCKRCWKYAFKQIEDEEQSEVALLQAVAGATKNLIIALVAVGSDEVTDFHINKTKEAINAWERQVPSKEAEPSEMVPR